MTHSATSSWGQSTSWDQQLYGMVHDARLSSVGVGQTCTRGVVREHLASASFTNVVGSHLASSFSEGSSIEGGHCSWAKCSFSPVRLSSFGVSCSISRFEMVWLCSQDSYDGGEY